MTRFFHAQNYSFLQFFHANSLLWLLKDHKTIGKNNLITNITSSLISFFKRNSISKQTMISFVSSRQNRSYRVFFRKQVCKQWLVSRKSRAYSLRPFLKTGIGGRPTRVIAPQRIRALLRTINSSLTHSSQNLLSHSFDFRTNGHFA